MVPTRYTIIKKVDVPYNVSTSTFEYCRILFGILFSLCLFCGGSFLCGSLGGSGRSLGLGTATT